MNSINFLLTGLLFAPFPIEYPGKRLALWLFALVFPLTVWAVEPSADEDELGPWPADRAWHFRGFIGSDLEIVMSLDQAETPEGRTSLEGSYYYVKRGLPLRIRGLVAGNWLRLTESDEHGTVTGVFGAEWRERPLSLRGTWTSGDGKRTLPFQLVRFADRISTSARNDDNSEFSSSLLRFRDESSLSNLANEELQRRFADAYALYLGEEIGVALETNDEDEQARARYRHALEEKAVLHYASAEFLSIGLWTRTYQGGAHGEYDYRALNVALVDGKPTVIGLKDLFRADSGYEELIASLVQTELKKQFQLDGDIERELPLNQLITDSFLVSPAGLLLIFSPYELGRSFGDGESFVLLPWSGLGSVLDRDRSFHRLLR